MVPRPEVHLREPPRPGDLVHNVIHRGCQVSLAFDRQIGQSHVHAEPHLTRLFRLSSDHDREYPGCRAFNLLDDVGGFQLVQLGFHLGSQMECDLAMAEGDWLDGFVYV